MVADISEKTSRMKTHLAVKRIRFLQRILAAKPSRLQIDVVRCVGSSNESREDNYVVKIGDATKTVKSPKHPEYVPQKYLPPDLSQEILEHLHWMLQKDILGQDIFLLGRPGPLRRHIAMQYLQMTGRELEFVSLSRDTTEADLKQRREIKSGTATYFDQSAVRAAVEGRVLILEGIEKAERNVLPVLNNLLENREMQLEDGRFLMAASRYDKMLKEHSREELDRWKLVRVSEDFRVIALGIPVPKYTGNPLDPPLRSRFQARDIGSLSFKAVSEVLEMPARWASSERPLFVRTVLLNGVRHAILSQDDPILQVLSPPQPPAEYRRSRRPSSRSSVSTNASSCSFGVGGGRLYRGKETEKLEHCLINLQLVLSANVPGSQSKSRPSTTQHRVCVDDTPPGSELEPSVSSCVIRCCELHNKSDGSCSADVQVQAPSNADLPQNGRSYVSRKLFSSSEEDESYLLNDIESYLPDLQLNPLSERVLQWLDLAGKSSEPPNVSDLLMEWDNRPQLRGKRRGGGAIIASAPADRAHKRDNNARTSPNVDKKDSPKVIPPAAENLKVNARGLKTRRKRYQAFTDVCASDIRERRKSPVRDSASPTLRKSSLKISEESHDRQQKQQEGSVQYFTTKPTRDRKSKRQLHIFMPVLVKDDASSECSSFWNDR